jgi:hypothetical protein
MMKRKLFMRSFWPRPRRDTSSLDFGFHKGDGRPIRASDCNGSRLMESVDPLAKAVGEAQRDVLEGLDQHVVVEGAMELR